MSLSYVHVLGDDPQRITQQLRGLFASGDVVFSFGGIGATPDDHTRQCAAAALGQPLVLHPQARALINERMQEIALQQGKPYDPEHPENVHRLNMGVFPESASLIQNPYNKNPRLLVHRAGRRTAAFRTGISRDGLAHGGFGA